MPARILVVDAEPSVLTVVSQALREEGHDVVSVSNGETAFDVLVSETIDAVVTNACVSGVTGAELVRALRRCIPGIPVLHLDDYAKAIPPRFRVPAEVPTLFFKPFDLVALNAVLRRLLSPASTSVCDQPTDRRYSCRGAVGRDTDRLRTPVVKPAAMNSRRTPAP